MNKYWLGLVCVSVALAANACTSDDPAPGDSAGSGGSSAGKGGASAGNAGKAGASAGAAGKLGAGGGSAAGSSAAGASDGGADNAAGAGGTGPDAGAAGEGDVDTAAGAGGADAAACNSVALQGAPIAKTSNAGAAPTMTGGTIPNGSYVLTKVNKYNGTQGSNQRRETLVFSAGHVEAVSENEGVATALSATYTAVGTLLTLSVTCPAELAGDVKLQYTYADNTLQTQSEPNSTDQEIDVLTKQ